MAANKLINFRCPDELLDAIGKYGRDNYPTAPNKRGTIDYDQSKAIKDILVAGIKSLAGVEIELEPVKSKPESQDMTELLDRIAKLESALDRNIEARLDAMELALAGK